LNLSPEDYCWGPETDADEPKEDVWAFGAHDIDGTEIYIKLKLKTMPEGFVAKCISFHKSTWPLKYPLQKKGG